MLSPKDGSLPGMVGAGTVQTAGCAAGAAHCSGGGRVEADGSRGGRFGAEKGGALTRTARLVLAAVLIVSDAAAQSSSARQHGGAAPELAYPAYYGESHLLRDTIAATQLDLTYPTAVLSNPSCVKAARLTNHALSTAAPASPPPPSGTTRLRTLIADLGAASTFTDGQLLSCTFTIKTTALTGTHSIPGDLQVVSDHAGNEPPSVVTSGAVTVY